MAKQKEKLNFGQSKPDIIVGLDMSLTSPGYARYIVEVDQLSSGFIDVKKMKMTGMKRILWLRDFVLELVESPNMRVVVFIEGYSFGSKGRSTIDLAELGGAVRIGLSDMNISFYEIPPASLKRFITGSGNSDKAVVLKELLKRYGHDINQNDEGDAVSLVEFGRAAYDIPAKPLVAFQKEVLSNL